MSAIDPLQTLALSGASAWLNVGFRPKRKFAPIRENQAAIRNVKVGAVGTFMACSLQPVPQRPQRIRALDSALGDAARKRNTIELSKVSEQRRDAEY
jgi:hypothetical protein